ncbi:MAG: T9SS type A sorting domain-containing protein [Rhodothermales bacterium]|nr:T9SS type A sorting domain-containing protein [Rhodothermales bacterium]
MTLVTSPVLAQSYGPDDNALKVGTAHSSTADISAAIQTVIDEEAILVASDRVAGENFGISVSLSGDRALIGAFYDDDFGFRSGSAYVFVRNGTSWTEEAKLLANDASANDHFGSAVSLQGDRALIGAFGGTGPTAGPGAAYVFERVQGVWTQVEVLTASDGAGGDAFGAAVSLNGDRALVGAYSDGVGEGSAYVFRFTGSAWVQEAKLEPDDGATNQQFGTSVALSDDRAIIGAENDSSVNFEQGSAYVFVRSEETWMQEIELAPDDGESGDNFGFSVGISDDRVIVGSQRHDGAGTNAGAAYVYLLSGASWIQEQKLTASDGELEDQFGFSVAISGSRALVGSIRDDDAGSASGSAYMFLRDGGTWAEDAKLTASDAASNNSFGSSVSIDGERALVGASGIASSSDPGGASYVFSGVTTVSNEPLAIPPDLRFEIAPNPVRSFATIYLTLDEPREASIITYNLLGQEILRSFSNTLPAGSHRLPLDTSRLASGVYLVRVEMEGAAQTRKLTVLP